MGPFEAREAKPSDNDTEYATFLEHWRQRWNIERGGPPVGSMEYAITERSGHWAKFIIDFIFMLHQHALLQMQMAHVIFVC